ncbi:hypothetical protein D3C72_1497390 [compost metagenome]
MLGSICYPLSTELYGRVLLDVLMGQSPEFSGSRPVSCNESVRFPRNGISWAAIIEQNNLSSGSAQDESGTQPCGPTANNNTIQHVISILSEDRFLSSLCGFGGEDDNKMKGQHELSQPAHLLSNTYGIDPVLGLELLNNFRYIISHGPIREE